MELPPFKLKGKNQEVVKLIKEKKQRELDQKFQSLPSVRSQYKNIPLANFKKPGQDILRAYEFDPTPSSIISGLIILYQSGAGEILLYPTMLIRDEDIENVHAAHQLDESPFQVGMKDLQKSFTSKDGKYAIDVTSDDGDGYEDTYQLLLSYYRWIHHTFIAEEESVPEITSTMLDYEFEELEDFLDQ